MAPLPEELPPGDLPIHKSWGGSSTATPTKSDVKATPGDRPKVGAMPLKVPEFPNEAWAYVPENYDPSVPCGVVIWFTPRRLRLEGAVGPLEAALRPARSDLGGAEVVRSHPHGCPANWTGSIGF